MNDCADAVFVLPVTVHLKETVLERALVKSYKQVHIFLTVYVMCVSFQESEDGKTYFLKIHVPWEVLATYADVLKIKVPFKANDIPAKKEVPMSWLFTPYRLPDHVMHPEPDYFTYTFDKSKIDFFLIEDKETFFPPSTRNRIVRLVIRNAKFYIYI